MSNSTTTANVRIIYLEHQDLTCIRVKPTFNTLHSMVIQLKANVISVLTTLGGSVRGYVRDILSPVTYATLAPLIPSLITTHPGSLNLTVGAT